MQLEQLENAAMGCWHRGEMDQAQELFLKIKSFDPDNSSLLRFSGLAALHKREPSAERIFQRLTEKHPADAEAWFGLGMAAEQHGHTDNAEAAFLQTIKLQSDNFAAHLQLGQIYERRGQKAPMLSHYLAAARLASNPKSIPEQHPLSQFLRHARAVVGMALETQIEHAFQPIVDKYGPTSISRIRQCADIFLGKSVANQSHSKWKPGLFYVPGLSPTMFFEPTQLANTQSLEAHFADVKKELTELLSEQKGFSPYIQHAAGSQAAETWKDLNNSTNWSTFHLFRHGKRVEENCARCPMTTKLVESLDLVRIPGYGPEVMFSVLAPKTRIKAHHGPANGRVIVHFPLIVPENCGGIRVGDETRSWQAGKLLAFDDAFEHEAWNDSDEVRVVLIFDVWNPELSPSEREAFSALHQVAQDFERSTIS